MFLLLLLHLVVGCSVVAFGRRMAVDGDERRAFAVAAIAPFATVIWAATRAGDVLDGAPVTESFAWVEGLGLTMDLRLDAFALVMVTLISGIGVLIFTYAVEYFRPHAGHDATPAVARLAGIMTLFSGAMLGVVLSDHLIALFIFWELTSITSYLLIGNGDTNARARAAALQAILITGMGGLVLLAGLILIGQAGGTYRLSELIADPPSGSTLNIGLVCVLVGAFTKSAQAPFSSWLPGAMVAPTPVSAYLHSATMVKAGVYLVARLAPMFAMEGSWRVLVLTIGSLTMLTGGLRALRQNDLKLLLAYGTVSQLGFMMLLFGTGDDHIAQAGVVLLLAHAAFKAALFMVVGIVDHETGTRDITKLRGFAGADGSTPAGWRIVQLVAVISAASMAGLPPLFGFISKEKALEGYLDHGDFVASGTVLTVIVVASMLTFAYSARFVLGMFGAFSEATREPPGVDEHAPHVPSARFIAPAALLAVITLSVGLFPQLVDRLVETATVSLQPDADPSHLHLWAGFTDAFALSGLVILAGTVLAFFRAQVSSAQRHVHRMIRRVPTSEQVFNFLLRGTGWVARNVTAVVQNGSLPIYLAVIMLTATVVPLVGFATELGEMPQLVETPIHLALVATMVGAALGACLVRRRIAAALMLGAIGYAMAGLYITQGAPDLALTQFAIETLATVLFVLVLRFLPSTWTHRASAIAAPMRIAVAATVGAAIFVFALVASEARTDVAGPQQSEIMVENALPKGKGHNVVNVILVDFRGWDTMGEITVLLVAAAGAVSLARPGRRRSTVGAPTFEEILDDQ